MIEELTERATDAMLQWRGRRAMPSRLGSVDLRDLSREVRLRSVFSARTANATYLAEVGNVVDDILSGKIDQATGRMRLFKKLKQLGYDPERGFPEDMGKVPPAMRDSIRDLSSAQRLNLLIETNVRMAQGYGMMVSGMEPYALRAYPAWELVRVFPRLVPRGTPESRSEGWGLRWKDAGESVDWEGALPEPMMALKGSPIWAALGAGAGGYEDGLDNPFPPFAFNSGMGWRPVSRSRVIEHGLDESEISNLRSEIPAKLAPDGNEVREIFDRMPADLRAELLRELEAEPVRVAPRMTVQQATELSRAGLARQDAMWKSMGGDIAS